MRYHLLAGALARRPLPSRLHGHWQRGVGKVTCIVACWLCSEQAPRPNCSLKRDGCGLVAVLSIPSRRSRPLAQALGMYSTRQGFSKAVRVLGVPIYLHWSFPLGAALPCFIVGFRVEQSVYLCVGYVLLIAIHELGHAFAARVCRLDVLAIEITGFGGACVTEAPRTAKAALILFSGGLLAQLVLLLVTGLTLALFGSPPTLFLNCLVLVFTLVNIIIFIGNVVPSKPLSGQQLTDGYVIWHAIRALRAGHA